MIRVKNEIAMNESHNTQNEIKSRSQLCGAQTIHIEKH